MEKEEKVSPNTLNIIEFSVLMISIAGMFFWSISESKEDKRALQSMICAIHTEIGAIHAEMKDFHGRLCAIEERRKLERE